MRKSSIFAPISAATQARNPRHTYARIDTGGVEGIQLTAGSANVLGSYSTIGTLASNASAIILEASNPSTAAMRSLVSIRRTSDSTIIIPEFFIQVGSANTFRRRIPIAVASGITLEGALRSSTAASTLRIGMKQEVANSTDAPGGSALIALNSSTAATRAGTRTGGTAAWPNDGTWGEIIASTAADYIGLLFTLGDDTVSTGGYRALVEISTGAAGSEAASILDDGRFNVQASSPNVGEGNSLEVESFIPAGTRLSARITTTTSNADTFRLGAWGVTS